MNCCRIPVNIKFNYNRFLNNLQEFFTDCIENCKDDLTYFFNLIDTELTKSNEIVNVDNYEMNTIINIQPELNQSIELPRDIKINKENQIIQVTENDLEAIKSTIGINTDDIIERINQNLNIKISEKSTNTNLNVSEELRNRSFTNDEKIEFATSIDWDLV